MKKIIFYLITVCLMGSLVGCTQSVTAQELKSDKQRINFPEISQTEIKSLVDGNSAFALDLFQKLIDRDENLFYSPYSISLALAMTYAGASGQTAQEMANTLHFYLNQDKLHSAFNWLDIELVKRGEGASGKDEEGFRLNIVNAIWGQENYRFLDAFLDVLAENYGAGLRILDFIKSTEVARNTINEWISQQTEGRIEELIPQGAIDAATRLVLTNAIYFNAAWMYPFDEENTVDRVFYLLNDDTVSIPMMNQTEFLNYVQGDNYQAVELPYDGNELSMFLLMPDKDSFTSFEESIDSELINNIIDELTTKQVVLSMPKFEFKSEIGLKQILAEMGMPTAFSGMADFSGMTKGRDLFIDDVLHEAFVSVDEAGTEAAAATAVIMKLTAAEETVTMSLDHPFIFLIRDMKTDTVLFVGRVLNPTN
ncbi:MAG: serpin family protein [Dehalococcoidia bacterium]|nr:MAG: serpin family protein [Dehalococcoidia bacterium]